jgi:hypothetical protein
MGNVTAANQAGMANVADLLNQAGGQAVTQYGQGLEAQARALSVAPQTAELLTMPGQVIGGAGDFWRQTGQEILNSEIERHNWEQQLPYNLLDMYRSQVSGAFPMNSTTSMAGGGNNTLNTLLQLGGMGATLYGLNQMGNSGQNMSPMLAAMMMGNMWGGR